MKRERLPKKATGPSKLNQDTRARLESAVLEIFSENDFHKAKIKDIASKAGISNNSIYNYYGSKEGLLQGIEDLKERLRKVFWVQMDFYERNPRIGRILFTTVPQKNWMKDKSFKQQRLINLQLDVLRKGQRDGYINPSVRAGVLLDFMNGLIQRRVTMWIYRGQKESLVGDSNMVFEMLWRAISLPEKEK